ncbi:hypothetical protein CDD81_5902 [Ophiocordyceps australis]|uniref:Uncharacterized protein n=1 Tax=Ophiocordyceps australis TaxID=1399860 RepID=A0A2C5YH14_9HYPO|nr:hypothetical protein CDD81_5902 [Ophiocordyceps australis]
MDSPDISRGQLAVAGLRKRRTAPLSNSQQQRAANHVHSSKKQRLGHPTVLPASFWDSLSVVPLTRNSLRELTRRHAKISRNLRKGRSRGEGRRPIASASNGSSPPVNELLNCRSSACHGRIEDFARHGGPDLRDVRGYRSLTQPSHNMGSSQFTLGSREGASQSLSSLQPTTFSIQYTNTSSPYDAAFQQHLIDNSILPLHYQYPDGQLVPEPENLADIRQYISKRRDSLSPPRFSELDFENFKREDTHAIKKTHVISKIFPFITGVNRHPHYRADNIAFNNLAHLGQIALVAARPDLYYGAHPEQLNLRIRQALGAYIIPSTEIEVPLAPNFFVQVKSPGGSFAAARRQLSYAMALGARGLESLRIYGEGFPDFKNAHTLGCIFSSGMLSMYASHHGPPSTPGAPPRVIITQVGTWALAGDFESFQKGVSAFRNGRDWAKQQGDGAIKAANERAAAGADAAPSAYYTPKLSFACQSSACKPLTTS